MTRPFVVAVTGAQGVGKSTFCRKVVDAMTAAGTPAQLLAGLGDDLRQRGYTMGMAAGPDDIVAVALAHLQRERRAAGPVVVLDRCMIDMLAYIRCLQKTPEPLLSLYTELAALSASRFGVLCLVEMGSTFAGNSAQHETAQFRKQIADEIERIVAEFKLDPLRIDVTAADPASTAAHILRMTTG